jgi:hypothetical protein
MKPSSNGAHNAKKSFITLKKLLTTAPVLAQPDIEKSFDVYYDASGTSIRGVLMQDGHAIAYAFDNFDAMKTTTPPMI